MLQTYVHVRVSSEVSLSVTVKGKVHLENETFCTRTVKQSPCSESPNKCILALFLTSLPHVHEI